MAAASVAICCQGSAGSSWLMIVSSSSSSPKGCTRANVHGSSVSARLLFVDEPDRLLDRGTDLDRDSDRGSHEDALDGVATHDHDLRLDFLLPISRSSSDPPDGVSVGWAVKSMEPFKTIEIRNGDALTSQPLPQPLVSVRAPCRTGPTHLSTQSPVGVPAVAGESSTKVARRCQYQKARASSTAPPDTDPAPASRRTMIWRWLDGNSGTACSSGIHAFHRSSCWLSRSHLQAMSSLLSPAAFCSIISRRSSRVNVIMR
mmetsp:Transcript_85558/g.261679  ORF Transcript_85558/g.261679 Transcript_85558/m.261679 type:complete len:259 (-) Transcript_85558:1085-1861(-)